MNKIKTKIQDEPVITRQIVGFIMSWLTIAIAFRLDLSSEQFSVLAENLPKIVGGIVTLIMGVASVSARGKVSPVK